MMSRVERSLDRLSDEARDRYSAMVDNARNTTERAAGRVRKGKAPVKTLSRLGVKLTGVSHKTTANVLRQQTKLIEQQLDALASRLRAAANAGSIRELVREQVKLVPEDAAHFVANGRATLSIVANAGGEVRELLGSTVSELRQRPAPRTAKKKVQRTAQAAKKKAKTATKRTRKAA